MNLVRLENDPGAVVSKAAEIIRSGGLIVCPTDTVYGLLCDADSEQAVARLLGAKGRPPRQALPVAVSGWEQASCLAEPTEIAAALTNRFWPGALTVVLNALPQVSPLIAPDGTVGVRAPDSELVQGIIRSAGSPVVATSANLSGGAEPISLDLVAPELLEQADLVVDAGELPAGRPSTVVDARTLPVTILRLGALDASLVLVAVGQT